MVFLGGVRTVTGSATFLEKGSLKWLVDCGMFQGGRALESRNWKIQPYRPKDLSFVLLTHAHIDHSGLIPKLVKEGFSGKVICTKATLDLCEIMLRDSGHIQEMEAEWENRKGRRAGRGEALPLYTVKDAERSLSYFHPVKYGEIFQMGNGVKVRFQDAGHILGSAIIELWTEEGGGGEKIIFSGDLGNSGQPLVKDPSIIEEGDFLWLESTYGNRSHKSREETAQELLKIVQEAIAHQSKVIIPAFAVERTQEVIYTLGQFIRMGSLPSIPVYIDSPLAISATEIFKRNSDYFDQEAKDLLSNGANPLELPEVIYTSTTEESKKINDDPRPGIIISASGMCDSGRIKHHLWKETSHIVFIGYQAEGSIGRKIVDGAKKVRLFGEEIAVKAYIHTLGGFSAHADQKGLLDWLSHFHNPQLRVFVTHGEEKIAIGLSQIIQEKFHFKTTVPQWRERMILFLGKEKEVEKKRIREVLPTQESLSSLFRNLDRTFKRLRRKLKREQREGRSLQNSNQFKQLEEINKRLKELEEEF